MAAVRAIESGGNRDPYSMLHARTPTGDRAVGAYGIMGSNVPKWTKDALGYPMTPEQFRGNRNAQDITFRNRFEENYIPKYGEEGAARAWYGGETGMRNLAATDQHKRLTVAGYGQDFMRRLGDGTGGDTGNQIVVRPPGSRDAVTAAVMNQPPSDREMLSDALLAEVVGGGDRGLGAQTAALGRGDVASDAPDPGVGALIGSGIGDTVKARRNAITNTIQQQQQQQLPAHNPGGAAGPGGASDCGRTRRQAGTARAGLYAGQRTDTRWRSVPAACRAHTAADPPRHLAGH